MTIYVTNAVSLNMFEGDKIEMSFRKCSEEEARMLLSGQEVISAVRHGLEQIVKDVARECHTFEQVKQLKLSPGTYRMLVLQYAGPRLEPGTVVLPRGAKLTWFEGTVTCK